MNKAAAALLCLYAVTAAAQKPATEGREASLAMDAAGRSAIALGCAETRLTASGRTGLPSVSREGRVAETAAIHHFSAAGCSRQNVLVMSSAGASPRAMALLPGTSNTDPLLQRDVIRPALALAAARLNNCAAARIVDTRTVQPPSPSGWAEEWVASGCGGTTRISVTFRTSRGGGTDYSIRAGG